MLFNSLTYLLFMLIAVPLAWLGTGAVRRAVLLTGSLLFYAFWRVDFTLLVVFSAVVDFLAARAIHTSDRESVRKACLVLSLTVNLGLLVFFKYTYFLVETAQGLCSLLSMPFEVELPQILLPLGISFYTFQTISYTIDVYRRVQEPVSSFSLFLTYVMFWPQLVAGPILRAHEVLPQLAADRRPTPGEFVLGLQEILAGLFKKVVLADTIAAVVDEGFRLPVSSLGMLDSWSLAFAFGLQIYFDFSGYSQIAIGSARVLGFSFPQNFNWPYLAVSPRDFWKRWHISLSAWIRDYLYLPLQGVQFRNRSTGGIEADAPESAVSGSRKLTALWLTWLIMGLWHGASWRFAVWGLWHAGLITVYRSSSSARERLPATVRTLGGWVWTIPLAMLGWLFFRAETMTQATHMLVRAFDVTRIRTLAMRENNYLIVFVVFSGMLLVAAGQRLAKSERAPQPISFAGAALANSVMIASVFLLLREVQQFIYFQF